MLPTKLKHIQNEAVFQDIIQNNKNVLVTCGRLGPRAIPVYRAIENLRSQYPDAVFCDMMFDLPDARVIRNLQQCIGFADLPFTVYFQNGKVLKAVSGLQSEESIKKVLDEYFVSEKTE